MYDVQRALIPDVPEYFSFTIASVSSLIAMIVGTYATKPTDQNVLFEFYRRTRPFGFWGPTRKKIPQHVIEQINQENRRDKLSTFLAYPGR